MADKKATYTTAQVATEIVTPGAGEQIVVRSASLRSVGPATARLEFASGSLPVASVGQDGWFQITGEYIGEIDEPLTITCDAGDVTMILQYASI